jgi:ATP-dependent Clp protease ATP-binding subunit ClpX
MGFNLRRGLDADPTYALQHVVADDLLEFGLIPEFVGRLPVVVSVEPLDVHAMMRILMEPKNALVRQYKRLLALDGVDLVFTEDALRTTAEEAMKTQIGARGLRTILERTLLDVMYEIPSRDDVQKCVVRAETVRGESPPLLLTRGELAQETETGLLGLASESESA